MSRQYQSAGEIVNSVLWGGKNFKQACRNRRTAVGKVDYALACETLKYSSVINEIMSNAEVRIDTLDINNKGVFFVMLYELLFGKGKIDGGGAVKRKVIEYLNTFKVNLNKMMELKHVKLPSELLSQSVRMHSNLPRYLRINELKVSIPQGVELVKKSLNQPSACPDSYIPSLIQLSHGITSLGDHELVKEGVCIIQDKASCFPSQILMDAWTKGDIIDCCAAPGNKTSHMAAQLHQRQLNTTNRNTIYAFDKNSRRADLLRRRMDEAGASNVNVQQADFLSVDESSLAYRNVRNILVDPSCSGSGVIRSLDRAIELGDDGSATQEGNKEQSLANERLNQLQAFQISIVRKAMSFPHVQIVVYSTCSIHEEEDEAVVASILAAESNWDVKAPQRMTQWARRGHPYQGLSDEQSKALIRCLPEDGMNGFFVALFCKKRLIEKEIDSGLRINYNKRPRPVDDSKLVTEKNDRCEHSRSRWRTLRTYRIF